MMVRYLSFIFILTFSSNLCAGKQSAGVLPMFDDGTILMGRETRFSNNLKKYVQVWSDFGGADDPQDKEDTARTAVREANEETANTLKLTYEQVASSPYTDYVFQSGGFYRMYYVKIQGPKPSITDFRKNANQLNWRNVEKTDWRYVSAQELLDVVNEKTYAASFPGTDEGIFAPTRVALKNNKTAQSTLRKLIESAVSPAPTPASTPAEEPIAGTLTFNSTFLASSAKTTPQGYKLTDDPAQKRGTKVPLSVAPRGEGHVALTGDGYVFYQELLKDDMVKLNGKTISFEVDVKSNVPGAYIQYWDYPNSHKTKSLAHLGKGAWQTLSIEFKIDASKGRFFLYPAIMPGVEPGSESPVVEIRRANIREIKKEDLPLTFNSTFLASSATTIPQGYTLTNDPAQKRGTKVPLSVVPKGEGHIALTGDGYVFYYQLLKDDVGLFADQKVSFEVDMRSDTPGAYIQYWDYPNPYKTQSTPYDGSGEWRTLKLDFIINSRQTMFFLYPAIMPGVKEGSPPPVVEVKDVRFQRKL
ncbi:MAG: hypothetical protein K2P93_00635 [Alphaproteobacteria bacterium]|nr:hypothetical protein [Alphaproteobacteria bacterium]